MSRKYALGVGQPVPLQPDYVLVAGAEVRHFKASATLESSYEDRSVREEFVRLSISRAL